MNARAAGDKFSSMARMLWRPREHSDNLRLALGKQRAGLDDVGSEC
jgi:hypothetical protein